MADMPTDDLDTELLCQRIWQACREQNCTESFDEVLGSYLIVKYKPQHIDKMNFENARAWMEKIGWNVDAND